MARSPAVTSVPLALAALTLLTLLTGGVDATRPPKWPPAPRRSARRTGRP